jgi:hypothetical protein
LRRNIGGFALPLVPTFARRVCEVKEIAYGSIIATDSARDQGFDREPQGREWTKATGRNGRLFYQDFGLFYQDFGLFYQDFGRVWKELGLSGTLGMCAVASRGMYHHPVRLFGRVLDPEVYTSQKPQFRSVC